MFDPHISVTLKDLLELLWPASIFMVELQERHFRLSTADAPSTVFFESNSTEHLPTQTHVAVLLLAPPWRVISLPVCSSLNLSPDIGVFYPPPGLIRSLIHPTRC